MSPLLPDQLHLCMTGATVETCAKHLRGVQAALVDIAATSPIVVACFLAQIGHESGSLRYTEEIASGAAYEGRRDLGNTHPGDGVRFKGRGLIQVTGRSNYAACGKVLGIDAIAHPELLATPAYAARSAAWYWSSRNLNRYASVERFDELTRRINGGQNGRTDRHRRLRVCREVLGA